MALKAHALIFLCALLCACPTGLPGPSTLPSPTPSPSPGPLIDPTEYVYDVSGSGFLTMEGGTIHPFSLAFACSSNPDFHVSGSERPLLFVYAYFEDSPLCLFIQLEYASGSWRAGRSSASSTPYLHLAYGPHPDAFVTALPYVVSPAQVSVETAGEGNEFIESLSFSSGDVRLSADPEAAAYGQGAVLSVAISLDFGQSLGYAAVDLAGLGDADIQEARFMDTRARLDAVSPELDASLSADPAAYAPVMVQTLTAGLENPLQKARVIHDWVAQACAYDYYWYETFYLGDEGSPGGFTPKSPFAVLMDGQRKTVCGGYALLYWYLCRLAGVHAPLSRGYVRSASDPSRVRDHTWNILRVGGQLYKVDCTADSRNAWTVEQSYVAGPHLTEWFMPPPSTARLYFCSYESAHRSPGEASGPEAFYAQYLPPALTAVSSYAADAFHQAGISLSAPRGLYDASSPVLVDLSIASEPWPLLYVDAIDMDRLPLAADRRMALLTRSGTTATIMLDPPDGGWYCYRLWNKTNPSGDGVTFEYERLAQFLVRKDAASPVSAPFPVQYDAFFSLGVQANLLPRDDLVSGRAAAFDLRLPGASQFYHGYAAWTFVPGDALNASIVPANLGTGSPNWRIGLTVDGEAHSILGYDVAASP